VLVVVMYQPRPRLIWHRGQTCVFGGGGIGGREGVLSVKCCKERHVCV